MKNIFAIIITVLFLFKTADGFTAVRTLTFDVDDMGRGDSETRVILSSINIRLFRIILQILVLKVPP